MNAEQQRQLDGFVGREVHYCVSHLIQELGTQEKYQEEILGFSLKYPEFSEHKSRVGKCQNCQERELELAIDLYGNDYCEKCYSSTDHDPTEALEFWIVSERLANQLESKHELITKDFYGLTIWGRTCSGQSISMDGIIQDCYKEIMQ